MISMHDARIIIRLIVRMSNHVSVRKSSMATRGQGDDLEKKIKTVSDQLIKERKKIKHWKILLLSNL